VASVGLNVVNEASFALGGEPLTNVETTFALDTQLLTPTLNVLGQTPLDLLNMTPSGERQLLARTLFSRSAATGMDAMLPRFDFNSATAEPPIVRSSVQALVQREADTLVNALRAKFQGRPFEVELW